MPRDPAAELRARRLRATPQRRAILGAFNDASDEHLSADEIHARALSQVDGISRGTVYATLAELTELGVLSSFGTQEPVRYETNVEPHDHFRCRLCMRVFDVDLPAPRTTGLRERGFLVESVGVVADGICADCGHYERGLVDGIAATNGTRQIAADTLSGLACIRHETTLGPILLAASADGIARVIFEGCADWEPFSDQAKSRRGSRAGRERIQGAIGSIDAFLGGDHSAASDAVDWRAAAATDVRTLEATRQIAWGETRSYHRLDADLGAYECGYVMGTNPLPFLFPCHRVTRGSELPDAYIGGSERRVALTALEGAISR